MYLSVLGRQSELSLAELEAKFKNVQKLSKSLATFDSDKKPDIDKLGGTLKLAEKLNLSPVDFLLNLPDGKLTIGLSSYEKGATVKSTINEAMKFKKILARRGRSVRIVQGSSAALSTATSLHNGLSGKNPRKVELIKFDSDWYKVIGVQDIDAYSRRDQARPARDAKVGMLPPKLAQILINLCGPLKEGATVLDPFCGTGVVLQEALLMGYHVYGTDLSEKMVDYTTRNLEWLQKSNDCLHRWVMRANETWTGDAARGTPKNACSTFGGCAAAGPVQRCAQADATTYQWTPPIDAVACEGYLGEPMSTIPSEIKLKEQQQITKSIILGFLKNLNPQIASGTPVTIAIPAWLREDHTYSRLEVIDEIENMGYNVNNKSREGLLYAREGQIVARDIIILRKK